MCVVSALSIQSRECLREWLKSYIQRGQRDDPDVRHFVMLCCGTLLSSSKVEDKSTACGAAWHYDGLSATAPRPTFNGGYQINHDFFPKPFDCTAFGERVHDIPLTQQLKLYCHSVYDYYFSVSMFNSHHHNATPRPQKHGVGQRTR